MKALIFDLDQTLIDSKNIELFRRNRQWHIVYEKIPTISCYKGINEVLSYTKKKDIKLAIVSSSPSSYVSRVTQHFKWSFDAIVCYHDTTLHKPHPAPFLEALDRLMVPHKDCWAIGDDQKDIIAAKAASIFTVAALWGSQDKESLLNSKSDIICETVESLYDVIKMNL